MTTTAASTTTTAAALLSISSHRRPISLCSCTRLSLPSITGASESNSIHLRRQSSGSGRLPLCKVALNPESTATIEEEEEISKEKIGSRVRVKDLPNLKVYHVPKVAELDLVGMEGELKQYVALWKGKRISANYPFKVQFVTEVEGRGPVKFFVHLREDEFEYIE